jgi:hypothetical protein
LGKEIFSLKIHLEYGGTFTKLFMHASSRTHPIPVKDRPFDMLCLDLVGHETDTHEFSDNAMLMDSEDLPAISCFPTPPSSERLNTIKLFQKFIHL